MLRTLAAAPNARRFRFYFDLSLKPRGETFPEYAARLLSPCMTADRARAYDLFLYLIRSGSALCVLDAVDEGVDEASPAGFLRLFADLAPVLSAESTVVMSSRVSFLADSPRSASCWTAEPPGPSSWLSRCTRTESTRLEYRTFTSYGSRIPKPHCWRCG